MDSTIRRLLVGGAARALAATAAAALALPAGAAAQQATTTGAVRGVVTGPEGRPLADVTVVAIDQATGVRRGAQTDAQGRFQLPFLAPGSYRVRAQIIGYRPVERPDVRVGLGQVQRLDLTLEQAAAQLGTVRVEAGAAPLVETTKTGAGARIDEQQIAKLPTNGRDFTDLIVLTPGVTTTGGSGAGGGQSIGGGRSAASNLLMDGVNNNEQFFGGDARGGDRAPFSFSIEAVKEIQVVTAGYDVERGQFTGGTVNAITKGGTNRFEGAVFNYLRQDAIGGLKLTGRDFNGAAPLDYRSYQYGAAVGGPIVKDRAHFFVTVDRQERSDPRFVLTGAALDRLGQARLDTITTAARARLGYDLGGQLGNFTQDVNQTAVFARVDWQLNDRHAFSLRNNWLTFVQRNDRLVTALGSSADFRDNAGPYETTSNSLVGSLTSDLGRRLGGQLTNELRAQYAFEDKPRPSNPSALGGPVPQVTINNIVGNTGVNFGSDPVLHVNLLNTKTLELIENLRLTRGDHTFKVGGSLNRVSVFNDFFNNSLGTYTYNSLADFAAGRPLSFTRALRYPGRGNPVADFAAVELAAYAQDEWQVTPRLFVTYGVRWDGAGYPDRPAANDSVLQAFALRTDRSPSDWNNVAPRLGVSYDVTGDGRTVVRGGTGLFFGRTPYVFMGNALSNTGQSQLTLDCRGADVPAPNLTTFATNPSSIPSTCASGSASTSGVPSVVTFSEDFQQSYAWKANAGVDREVVRNWRLGAEVVYSAIRENYLVTDENLNTATRFTADGVIPVLVRPADVAAANARISLAASRVNPRFGNVFVQNSRGRANSVQAIASLTGRLRNATVVASYTYDRTRDNGSQSCCIAGADVFGATRVVGNPNVLGDQFGAATYNRPHTVVFSPSVTLPYGFTVSGIYRGFSGTPWTPRYGADVNGDGFANDRLYVPTETEAAALRITGTAAQQAEARAALAALLAGDECLAGRVGRFAGRNVCRNPWQNSLDARVAKSFNTLRGQRLEVVADFFNILNGLSKGRGRFLEVSPADQALLTPVAFDPATLRYTYRVNPSFGTATPSQVTLAQQFQMQLGARYAF
jgi:hypothetical protein